MNKKQTGNLLGALAVMPVVISGIMFRTMRGPELDIHFIIKWYVALAVIGFVFAVFSWRLARNPAYLIMGLIGNVLVLGTALLLLLALGIGEP